jgi:soluble cytochrome b562
MKSLPRLLASLVVLFTGSIAFAADAAPAPATAADKKPETELTQKMDKMNGAFRKLRRQAGDATKTAESLELVATLREMSAASVKLEPARAATIPEAGRKKWIADYQAKMGEFQAQIDKLEAALKAGQHEEAVKVVQAMGALQKEGHKEYKIEDKK